mgnify:CR=1 FL=1
MTVMFERLVTAGFGYADGRNLLVGSGIANPNAISPEALRYRDLLNDEAFNRALRPYPQYTGVNTNSPAVAQNMGMSGYHALQLRAEKRFARGYNLVVVYTKSKLIDNGSGRIFGESAFVPPVQNAYDLRAERSISEGDVSQRLVVSHTVQIPVRRVNAFVDRVTRGWSASGSFSANTGFPLALSSIGNSGVGGGVLRPNSTGTSAKLDGAPHETLLVLDATTGQNGLRQAQLFGESVEVTGVALTKLDGTAKGGIVVAIGHELGLPVKLVGVGEAIEDLQPFDAGDFARALVGRSEEE